MNDLTLIVRILRGDPITTRGKFALPSYEVLFTVKRGAKAEFAPYGVCKAWEDFLLLHDSLHDMDIGIGCTHTIVSPFPPASEDREILKDPSKLPEAAIKIRLEQLTEWTHEVLEMIGELDPPLQTRMLSLVAKFMDLGEPVAPRKKKKKTTKKEKEEAAAEEEEERKIQAGEAEAVVVEEEPTGPKSKTQRAEEAKIKAIEEAEKLREDAEEAAELSRLVQIEDPAKVAMRECLRKGYHQAVKQARSRKYQRKFKKDMGLVRYAKERVEIDTFEQRHDKSTGYYLYNPYTGECITDATTADRSMSTWMLPDPHLSVREAAGSTTVMQKLYEHWYSSRHRKRSWEKGKYAKDITGNMAAVLIGAVGRGFLTRRYMRKYHNERYHRVYDEHNKCCYFLDLWTQQTSWFKPLLAHPYSIQAPPVDVREDREPMQAGPLFKKSFGKKGTEKVPKKALSDYSTDIPEDETTSREPEIIDLNHDFLKVTMWIDEFVCQLNKMKGLWEAYEAQGVHGWTELFRFQLTYCDDMLVQQFCLHAYSRMVVPMDPSLTGELKDTKCDQIVRKVFTYLLACVKVWTHTKPFGCNMFLGLGYALLNIFQNHPSRVAFFYGYESRCSCMKRILASKNVSDLVISVEEIGDVLNEDLDDLSMDEIAFYDQQGGIEARIETRMQIFCNMLKHIPVEITKEQHEKGIYGAVTDVARPTPRASEMVKIMFQVFGVLAHEREPRESVGFKCGPWVVQTMRACIEEPYVIQYGLRCLYNFMYMSFEGWRFVHMECDIVNLLKEVKLSPAFSDEVVQRDYRRVELSIETDGWRGKVEQKIGEEMERQNIAVYIAKKGGFTSEFSPESLSTKAELDDDAAAAAAADDNDSVSSLTSPGKRDKRKGRPKKEKTLIISNSDYKERDTTGKSALVHVE